MSLLNNILKAIGTEIQKIFGSAVAELKKTILPVVKDVTNALKGIIDADTTDILGSLLGAAGKAFEDKVRAALDVIVPKLQLAQQFLAAGGDSATILADIVKLLGGSPIETQTAFYIEFSGMLAAALAPSGELTAAEAVILSQWFYANFPTNTVTDPATPATPPAAPATPATPPTT
jgi:hypothetical protein